MNEDLIDERVREQLAQLRAAMSDLEAPARVKLAVLSEVRSMPARRSRARAAIAWWGAVAACAVLTATGLYWGIVRKPSKLPAPKNEVTKPSVISSPPEIAKQIPADRPPLKKKSRRRGATAPERSQMARATTDFFALPYAPPLDAGEGGSIVRVTLPKSAMRRFGIAIDEEDSSGRIPADVMLGSDGVARAVRFVSFQDR
jgi:hypothetical protein